MKTLIKDFFTGWKSILLSFRESRRDELRKSIMYFVWGKYAWLDIIGVFIATGIFIIFMKMLVTRTFSMNQMNINWTRYIFSFLGTLLDINILAGFYIGWRIRRFLHSEFYLNHLKMIPNLPARLYPMIFCPLLILPLLVFMFNYCFKIYSWLTNEQLRGIVGFWGFIFNIQIQQSYNHVSHYLSNFLMIVRGLVSPFFFIGMMYSKLLLVVLIVAHSRTGLKAVLGTVLIVIGLLVYERIGFYPSTLNVVDYYPSMILGSLNYFVVRTPYLFLPGFLWILFQKRFIRMNEASE